MQERFSLCMTMLTVIGKTMSAVIQVWNAADLSLIGVCSGHTGGVWCVQFSPVDQCLATASADGTVKMWALSNFSCVRVRHCSCFSHLYHAGSVSTRVFLFVKHRITQKDMVRYW